MTTGITKFNNIKPLRNAYQTSISKTAPDAPETQGISQDELDAFVPGGNDFVGSAIARASLRFSPRYCATSLVRSSRKNAVPYRTKKRNHSAPSTGLPPSA